MKPNPMSTPERFYESISHFKWGWPIFRAILGLSFQIQLFFFQAGTPLMILARKDYGSGSSRDWAAKGPFLLGVKAVIAETYERIHRSNLVIDLNFNLAFIALGRMQFLF